MKTNYHINTMGYIGIILIFLLTILTSCKKEENKAPTPSTPAVATTTVETFVLTSNTTYPTSMAFAVEDTVIRITNDTVVRYTLPLQYDSKYDTMTVTSRTPFTAGVPTYTIDHIIRSNSAYKLSGWSIHNSSTTLKLQFNQITVFNGNTIASYDLIYVKI